MKRIALAALALGVAVPAQAQTRLLITEYTVTPTAGEMVEIYNPGPGTVDLTDVYLTDATFAGGGTFYYNIVDGNPGGGGFGDFTARFPAGATIAAGEYQTVACADGDGAAGFFDTYGVLPTYEMVDLIDDPTVPNMLEGIPGSINGQGGLTNSGEFLCLFMWDGQSDLVTDLDYVMWGDAAEAVDKTGVSKDGPDADTDPSTYADDVAVGSQAFMPSPGFGDSAQRLMMSEGLEVSVGGNGAGGDNETSENLAATWVNAPYTPNGPTVGALQMSVDPGVPGVNTLNVTPTNAGLTFLLFSTAAGDFAVGACPGDGLSLALGGLVVVDVPTVAGDLTLTGDVIAGLGEVHIQAVDIAGCRISNTVVTTW